MTRVPANPARVLAILLAVPSLVALAATPGGAEEIWWSFRPIAPVAVPAPPDPMGWARTPVDAFVLQRLIAAGIEPAPEADRRTLIRRVTFDLTGLPPTPEETAAFLSDPREDAYERVVDRVLASPGYAERQARHWLDLARYADTHGFDKDKRRPHAWPYRDYVIRAFMEDKPYREFVTEQLAGDVVDPTNPDAVAATGFLAAGPWDFVGHVELREGTRDKAIARSLDRDEMLKTVASVFTSLTVHCARCHDHKFDPIPQADYYAMSAVFAGVERANRPWDPDPEVMRSRAAWTARRDASNAQVAALEREALDRVAAENPSIDADNAALSEEACRVLGPERGLELETAREERDQCAAQLALLPAADRVYAVAASFLPEGSFTPPPNGAPRPIYILTRGDVDQPMGDPVTAGAPSVIEALPSRFPSAGPDGADRSAFDDSSDSTVSEEGARRIALARWITAAENPLTWRSIANRVWKQHFGEGLVSTPSDFGHMGSLPSHPELLDWLAAALRDGRLSMKGMHRLLVTSSVYRQGSAAEGAGTTKDGDNRLLWRMNRRRLDAEEIYDAALQISGDLDRTMFGPGFQRFLFEDDHSPRYRYHAHDEGEVGSSRRSIYRFVVRSVTDPFFESLDCAEPSTSVASRGETCTPIQALALLNHPFAVRQAERLALLCEGEGDPIGVAFARALNRAPHADEREVLEPLYRAHGLAAVCRVIFNTNEFIFVD